MTGMELDDLLLPSDHTIAPNLTEHSPQQNSPSWSEEPAPGVNIVEHVVEQLTEGPTLWGWVYRCDSSKRNILHFDGKPLRVRSLWFYAANIGWFAGAGHGEIVTYCPTPSTGSDKKFPDFKEYQIVPFFGGVHWLGCHNSGYGIGRHVSDVYFQVNQAPPRYATNKGTFDIVVTGWS